MPAIRDHIDHLLDNTDHPVVERYLIAFIGYPENIELATRDDILFQTLGLDIDFNIRLHEIGIEFFDENGDLVALPENWKAQHVLGFESTYNCVRLPIINADIQQYANTPELWPWYTKRCQYCDDPMPMSVDPMLDDECVSCIVEPKYRV